MTDIWYYEEYYIGVMAPATNIVFIFLLILAAETKSQERREEHGPHYEFGNMNCPCGGGYHPSGHQPWVRSLSIEAHCKVYYQGELLLNPVAPGSLDIVRRARPLINHIRVKHIWQSRNFICYKVKKWKRNWSEIIVQFHLLTFTYLPSCNKSDKSYFCLIKSFISGPQYKQSQMFSHDIDPTTGKL